MSNERLRATLPPVVAILFLILALSNRPHHTLWLAMAVVFIVLGFVLRRKSPPPASGS